MAARTTHYAESLSRATTTSGTYQDKTTLTFTPDASSDYFFLHSCVLDNSTTTLDTQCRLRDTTASVTFTEVNKENKDANDVWAGFGLYKYTSSGSPSSTNFVLQYAAEGGTAGIADARVWALKADSADQYANSDSESTDAVGTYIIKTTAAFTPATTGDYLLIAYAEVKSGSTAVTIDVKLDVDGVAYGESNIRVEDTSTYWNWGTAVKVNLTGVLHTATIQFKTGTAATTARISRARILALRLDAFTNNYYAESRGRSTTTSTSAQDKTTLTQTPVAVKHTVIACGLIDDSANTVSSNFLVDKGGTLTTGNHEGAASTAEYPFFMIQEETLAASSTTWKTQYFSESTNTTGISESAIALLQIAATPGSTYEQTLSMGMRAGATATAVAVQAASVALGSRHGLALATTQTAVNTASFTVRGGFTPAANLNMYHSASANTLLGMSVIGGKSVDASVALAGSFGMSAAAGWQVSGAVSLGVAQGSSYSADWVFSSGITAETRQGFSHAPTQDMVASLGMTSAMGGAVAGGISAPVSTSLNSRLGFSAVAGLDLSDSIAIVANLGLVTANNLTLATATQFNALVGLAPATVLIAEGSIAIGTRVGAGLSATLVMDTSAAIGARVGMAPDVSMVLPTSANFNTRVGFSASAILDVGASLSLGASLASAIASAMESGAAVTVGVGVGVQYIGDVTSGVVEIYPGTLTLVVSSVNTVSDVISKASTQTPTVSGVSSLTEVVSSVSVATEAITGLTTLTSTETTLP